MTEKLKGTFFITGSTGFIGRELTKKLAAYGHKIHILVRDPAKAKDLLLPGVTLFKGDILDRNSIDEAMEGCSYVFHLAALAKPFSRQPDYFRQINVKGTENILISAEKHQIRKVVFTSSAGTFRPSDRFEEVDETMGQPGGQFTDYALTKADAEKVCFDFVKRGLEIVVVHPSRVFGPGLMTTGNSFTLLLKLYLKGKWHVIPGDGHTYGNYVFIDDVVNGHILAMERGKAGRNYILGGENLTFNEIFNIFDRVLGTPHFKIRISGRILRFLAVLLVIFARIFNKEPLITPGWISRYLQDRRLSSSRAIQELGYSITPFPEATKRTAEWIIQN